MSVNTGDKARETEGDKWTKIPEKEEQLCDQVEGMLFWLIGGDFYPLIVERNIQETLKFEEGGLYKADIFMSNHLVRSTKMCRW